jgi:hypothetical protein
MPLVFAAAASHAPGITAWPDAPPAEQRDAVRAALAAMRDELAAARVDALIMLSSEHWANFFLDHIGAFCVGRGDGFAGPIEPWLNIERAVVPGAPALAGAMPAASSRAMPMSWSSITARCCRCTFSLRRWTCRWCR